MTFIKKSHLLYVLLLLVATFVFLKNAWVCEDAYILFRSIEQLFAGNGPVWNPHERVQTFTSPLWFIVLAVARVFSSDVYLNAIVVSFVLWILTVVVLGKIFRNNFILLASILLFTASTGFFDYTSSGLENVLAYFIISIYVLNYIYLFSVNGDNRSGVMSKDDCIRFVLLLFGLIMCVRHDLALILLPATIYVVLENFRDFSVKKLIIYIVIALSPFVLYSLFSLIYYGFPFPNTAYAKLNTNISQMEMFRQGIRYFIYSFRYDTATLSVIFGYLLFSFFASEKYLKYLSVGVLLNLFYVVYVGGDFMQGRFLSYAYMVSVIVLLLMVSKIDYGKLKSLGFVVLCSYLVLYPHTPFNSPFKYSKLYLNDGVGVADERGVYFNTLSLYSYLIRDKEYVFPAHLWAGLGYEFKQTSYKIAIQENVGLFGYQSGTEKIIIDPLALSDPLLARMPATTPWRIGHFRRKIPDGYIESIINGNEVIVDQQVNEFYKKLKIVTQNDELFTLQRLKTIILFNVGAYNHLLSGV